MNGFRWASVAVLLVAAAVFAIATEVALADGGGGGCTGTVTASMATPPSTTLACADVPCDCDPGLWCQKYTYSTGPGVTKTICLCDGLAGGPMMCAEWPCRIFIEVDQSGPEMTITSDCDTYACGSQCEIDYEVISYMPPSGKMWCICP